MRGFLRLVMCLALGGALAPGAALAQVDPTEGPGGPVLLVTDAADPFGYFLAEILRTEGLNLFEVADLGELTPALLAQHEVVLLAEAALSAGDVQTLTDWVTAGGRLVALRPDPQLAGLLGLGVLGGTLTDGYLLVDGATAAGQGIVQETIQFHDTADLWTVTGATEIAALYADATTPAGSPAVTLHAVGMNGGMAAAFTYDLARSVAWTRQGNPAWAGLERDGQGAIRPWELFFSTGASAAQPHYVDLDKIHIPQADEQQRLLANLILTLSEPPLPRFWYFPDDHEAVVVMTGDQHGCCGGTEGRLGTYLGFDPPGCSVDDWECVRSTSYVYPGGTWSDADGVAWDALGFEIATHVETGCANWTPASLDAAFAGQLGAFGTQFPSLAAPSTHRLHCIVWSDWATQPWTELAYGVRFDTNYYYLRSGNTIAGDHPGMFTGSGMPMRFVDLDGTMIDVYQATTQMTDESEQPYPFTSDTILDRAIGPEGFYGAFTANMHQDNPVSAAAVAIVQSAQARGVPVVSSRQMLTWLDGRNRSSFAGLAWDGTLLSFDVVKDPGARNLRAMLPAQAGGGQLTSLLRDGGAISFEFATRKGIDYAVFDAPAGSYDASYLPDAAPPAISGLTAVPATDGTALVSWATDEPADSLVEFGTDPGSLTQTEASGARVLAHALTLTGLEPNTTYHYRARSTDAAANAATEPPIAEPAASFTTPGLRCLDDDTAAELGIGAVLLGTYVAETDDGEVTLSPTEAAEFGDEGVPPGWETALFAGGTSATVAGGQITLNGARVNAQAFYGPARSVEFVATFEAIANQHVGFAITTQEVGWAIFSTAGGGSLQARTHDGASAVFDTDVGAGWLGSPHTYRIDWNVNSVDFYIDGAPVASHTVTIPLPLRPLAADSAAAPGAFSVDWMRMTPYAGAGAHISRVVDAGTLADWEIVEWAAQEPAGTSVEVRVRTGNTPTPDVSWSPYVLIANSGDDLGQTARYLEYRLDLVGGDPGTTPSVDEISVTCVPGPDTFPPQIANLLALLDPDGTRALIAWTTDEPADSRVDFGTAPGSLTASESDAALVTQHAVILSGLVPNTTYHYQVTSADALANTASAPATPASFETSPAPAVCAVEDLLVDFQAGTLTGTHAAETDDGELILAPIEAAEFDGAALPAGWQGWEGTSGVGTWTVSGGRVVLDAGQVRTDAFYGPGHRLETVATFGATPNHHIGFGVDLAFTARWAIFSTRNTSTNLYARTHDGVSVADVDLGAGLLGAPHVFGIDWQAGSVDFYIDGALAHSQPVAISGDMRPIASDSVGGLTLEVDWMRMAPYAATGSFESQVYDAGERVDWSSVDWTADEPSGSTASFWLRTGDSPVPDAAWSGWIFLPAPGQGVGVTSRYAQLRADLTAGAAALTTPTVEDLALSCTLRSACANGIDDDLDTLIDGDDPGCRNAADPSEERECSDGLDNDGDGDVDGDDPACTTPDGDREGTQCDDDLDNDGDGGVDWDGGSGGGSSDVHCGAPSRNNERPNSSRCGLGFELALLLPGLALARRRLRRRDGA